MLLAMISSLLWSQNPPVAPCTDTVGISTDPRPGKAFNNEVGQPVNTFDWMNPVITPTDFSAGVFQTITYFNSPFFNNNFFLNYLANQTNSDFYPEDGWELIHWGFGYKVDGSLDSYDRELPVFILYNRYSGMLHVFGATYLVGYDVYGLELRLTPNSLGPNPGPASRPNYLPNGLFGMFQGETVQVLDEQTSIISIRANSKHSNQYKKFAHAAFPMAYDPCICQDWSSIQVWFHAVDTSKINLVGKTLGTITPIEDYPLSGTGPEFHPSWLNAVSTDGANNVIAGLEVHRFADELYQESINDMNAKGKTDIADQLAIAKIALELGVDLLGLIPIPGSGAPAAIKDAVKIIDKISKGMKIAGKGVSLSQSILKLKKEDDPAEPSLSIPALLRAEIRMSGYMVDADDQLASEFAVPGSKDSWTLPEANYPNQPYYPLYNEELGVFALLETPVIERVSTLVNSTDGICTNSQQITDLKYVTTEKRSYRLKNPIKYAVNRATRFNMEASNISAAIVIRNSRPATYDPTHQVVPSLGNLEEGADDFLYVSPFLPLECLEELTLYLDQIHTACGNPTYSPGTDTIFLRFVNTYITQKNSTNGFPLVSQQVLTFPVVIEDVSSLPTSPKVPFDLVLAGGEITGDIGAWRSVKVSGDIFFQFFSTYYRWHFT